MGYRAHKIQVEEKQKHLKRVLFTLLALLVLALAIFSAIVPPETWKYRVALPKIEKREEGELRIHFIDVGQGDCTLLELPDGKVMLIDSGDNTQTTKKQILRYLNALDIEQIDYLVLTHADKDHCGGVEEIVKWKKVLNAYLPSSSKTTDTQYAEAYAALADTDCELIEASRLATFGGEEKAYSLAFLYPYANSETDENNSNDMSSVLWLDYLGVNALFMGDASQDVETMLIRDDKLEFLDKMGVDLSSTEILKVGHHGSGGSSSSDFLEYLNLKTAVVSCGKDNSYGHPSDRVIENLKMVGASVYRTDKSGHIILTISEDKSIEVTTVEGKNK